METKQVKNVHLNSSIATNKFEIQANRLNKNVETVWKNLRKIQPIQRQQFYSNATNQQQIVCNLSENIMFQHPRRRKFYQKRVHQGHHNVRNLSKMFYFTDNRHDEDMNSMQLCQIMLKSSVALTMW